MNTNYDKFYSSGGWAYDYPRHRRFIAELILQPLNLQPAKLLEIGCGMGYHAQIWHDLGFAVTGIDPSAAGINFAQANFPKVRFLVQDAANVRERYNLIFARGMSWYHYELDGVNRYKVDVPKETSRLFTLLEPGGYFILQIRTNFRGTEYKAPQKGIDSEVINNPLSAYRKLFAPFGKIVLMTDWHGTNLMTMTDEQARGHENIIIAIQKTEPTFDEINAQLPVDQVSIHHHKRRFLWRLIKRERLTNCLELGFANGVSSCIIGGATNGRLLTYDLPKAQDRSPNIQQLLQQTGLYNVDVRYENGLFGLADAIERGETFDLIFIDTNHLFAQTLAELYLAQRICRGFIVLDDANWTCAISPSMKEHRTSYPNITDREWNNPAVKLAASLTNLRWEEQEEMLVTKIGY